MLMTSKAKDQRSMEMFGDNKKMLSYVKKEVYWEAISVHGESIIDDLQKYGEELPDDFPRFVKNKLPLLSLWAFYFVLRKILVQLSVAILFL